ncbi:MAG: CDP-glycerol glycerophosphotransferase family protein [bacterium]|nr:CDP-glycerol glycerophosphotransferase family protein [bacterium]MDZ4296251.1 CDP-glycerol glycerophosphotransferase family protein [Patescibacteria group bacterium]
MKTVFITSFHPLISRNILATALIERLTARGDIRVVVIAPEGKREFFQDEFGARGAVLEFVAVSLTRRDLFLRYLSLAFLQTTTLRLKRKTEMRGSGAWLAKFAANRTVTRRLLRQCSTLLTPTQAFKKLFDRYRPDLIFSTDVQNEQDLRLMHAARRRAVRVLGMVRSWDNLTSKGLLRVIPDRLIVHNGIVQREATTLHGVPEERICVVGIPHYDAYATGARRSRNEFYASIGAEPQKRLVLCAPAGNRYIRHNTVDADVVRFLDTILGPEYAILVRMPPTDEASGFEDLAREGRIILDRPAKRFRVPKKAELSAEDDAHLADTLWWCTAVVTGPSTLMIDAAFFDRPVVLVGFDGDEERPYLESIRRYYDYDHVQPVLRSDGVRLAKTKEELATELRAYLLCPERDRDGRRRIVAEECFAADGKSTERLARAILGELSV